MKIKAIKKKVVSPLDWDDNNAIEDAFKRWCLELRGLRAEKEVASIIEADISRLQIARQQMQLSNNEVAKRLGISPMTYLGYERAEKKGAISIQTLQKAAEAMGCEFVYAIRPKADKSFAQVLWEHVLPTALKHKWVSSKKGVFKSRALVSKAMEIMNETEFREKMGWSERRSLGK